MPKITNPVLLAINDLKGSIVSLKQPKIVEEAMLELLARIKKLYMLDNEVCKLCYPYLIYPQNLGEQERLRYQKLLKDKLLERRRVFANAMNINTA